MLTDINKAINSSIELRNKKELIDQFIHSLDAKSNVDDDWIRFVEQKKQQDLDKIIDEENLKREATYVFIDNAFRDGFIKTIGTDISEILPKISYFSKTGERTKKRETVLDKLMQFFDRYFDISTREEDPDR